jgi:alkylation response protein AidB-like acyl-CoA dehydrogenase
MPVEAVQKGERFLAALGAFLQDEVDPQLIERENRIPDEVVDGFKALGALGMKVPEAYGGLGLSQVYYNRAMMLIGTWHSSLSTLLSAHQSIGLAQPLLLFGSEEQKQEWLPKVATTHVSAFALTEPGVGSDPARVTTTATPTENGDGYLLNGRKLWTTNGTVADVLVVLAKVPRSEGRRGGITAFIVPSVTDGVVVEHRIEFMGLHGIENSQTRYTDAYVPAENVIGREGLGLKIALATLNTGRLALPAICAGVAKWATKVAREFASQRVQWGKPIGEHDEVSQRIAFIAATAFGLEAMLDVASRLADEKRNDVRIEAAIAKLYGSEMGWRVIDELMQVCGGRGYETARSLQARGLRGVPVEQVMRDMRVNRIFEGSTEIMHLIIAREAMDQHLHVARDLMEPDLPLEKKAKALGRAGAFYATWYPKLAVGRGQAPQSYGDYGELAGQMRYVERASRKLARSTFYGMARWQEGTEAHGAFLGRIVDIGAELFAMSAAVVYTQTAIREHPERATETQELAEAFCDQAQLRAERMFHDLWTNADQSNHRLALDVLSGRHTWLEAGIIDPSAGDGPMVPTAETDRGIPVAAARNGPRA